MDPQFSNPDVDPNLAVSVINQQIDQQWKQACNANSALRHEDFLRFKQKIVTVRRDNLIAVQDLLGRGLVTSEEMTTTQIGIERLNEFRDALQTMGEVTDDNNDTTFDEVITPMPITHSGFTIPFRQGFGYKRTLGLDESVRTVSKKLDNMLVNGAPGIVVAGNTVFGYTTHPDRIQETISDWSLDANTALIVPEFTDAVSRLVNEAFVEGSNKIMVYISKEFWGAFNKDYKAEVGKTVRKRLMEDLDIIIDIKVSHRLAAKTFVMVDMSSETVEMSRASDVQMIPHLQTRGMLSPQKFTTFAIMAPIFHADRGGNLGVLHGTL